MYIKSQKEIKCKNIRINNRNRLKQRMQKGTSRPGNSICLPTLVALISSMQRVKFDFLKLQRLEHLGRKFSSSIRDSRAQN